MFLDLEEHLSFRKRKKKVYSLFWLEKHEIGKNILYVVKYSYYSSGNLMLLLLHSFLDGRKISSGWLMEFRQWAPVLMSVICFKHIKWKREGAKIKALFGEPWRCWSKQFPLQPTSTAHELREEPEFHLLCCGLSHTSHTLCAELAYLWLFSLLFLTPQGPVTIFP